MGLQQYDEANAYVAQATLTIADTTVAKAVIATGGTERVRVDALLVWSNDTAAAVVNYLLYNGATAIRLGGRSVPAGSGTAGAPLVNLLETLPASVTGLVLPVGFGLSVGVEANITTAKTVQVTLLGGTV